MFDRDKIFNSKRVTPPVGSGFRGVGKSGQPLRHHWPIAAIASCLCALVGLRYTIHNWHHPDEPSHYAVPFLALALVLGAWNRFSRKRRS